MPSIRCKELIFKWIPRMLMGSSSNNKCREVPFSSSSTLVSNRISCPVCNSIFKILSMALRVMKSCLRMTTSLMKTVVPFPQNKRSDILSTQFPNTDMRKSRKRRTQARTEAEHLFKLTLTPNKRVAFAWMEWRPVRLSKALSALIFSTVNASTNGCNRNLSVPRAVTELKSELVLPINV